LRFLLRGILIFVFGLLIRQANAIGVSDSNDTLKVESESIIKKNIPAQATIFSAVLPGLGQVYNKKYWKVPIVWGGFVGLGYVINYFNKAYVNSKKAYTDLMDNNPNTKSYETTYPEFVYTNKDKFPEYYQSFNTDIVKYRKQRDTYIIITAAFYFLNILDANVDAHFIDFDISEDLTFNFEPIMFEPITNTPILGGQITFTF
jgi:hypothetical protein